LQTIYRNRRILLLDNKLSLRCVIFYEHQPNYKELRHLCYREQSGQLLVGFWGGVAVLDVLCRLMNCLPAKYFSFTTLPEDNGVCFADELFIYFFTSFHWLVYHVSKFG